MEDYKQDDWVHFSHNYLGIAILGCDEILNAKHYKNLLNVPLHSYEYGHHELFIAIIFNIKHGIEVFTKTLKIILADELNKSEKHHNIVELFKILQKEIKKHNIINTIIEEQKKDPTNHELNFIIRDLDNIKERLLEVETIVKKYYKCDFLKDKLDSNLFTIEDIDNTTFKYPENSLKINIKYGEVLSKLSDSDIEEAREDAKKLYKNFNELGYVFDVYKKLKKPLEN
jgi:hypothetical protein